MTEKSAKNEKTKSDEIWDRIKDLPVNMYALPDQVVANHVTRVEVSPLEVHLKIKSPAILPALEEAIATLKGERYEVRPQDGGWMIVAPVPDPLDAVGAGRNFVVAGVDKNDE